MKEYRFLLYIISTLLMINGHHAGELDNNTGDKKSSSAEVSRGNIVGKGQTLKEEDKQRNLEKYRDGLLKALLNGFEIKKPVKAIEENRKSFIKYIKEKKRKGFNYDLTSRIMGCLCLGFYSSCLMKDVDDLLENPRPYYEEPCYKKNQKSIDDYDRFEAIRSFLSFFSDVYSPSAASLKKCSNIFTKFDNIIRSNNDGGCSMLSDVGFRLYIYECMSKLRISPEEACAKLKDVSEEEIQYITQILDELQASEEDFLRSFYDNTSLLQQYGFEDCATCEGEDKWKVDNSLFTIEGTTTGRDDTKLSIQSRFNFTDLFKNFFPIILPVALVIFAFYVMCIRESTGGTLIRRLGFIYFAIICIVDCILFFIYSKPLLYKLLWACVLLPTGCASFFLGSVGYKDDNSRAYYVLGVPLLIFFLLLILKPYKIIFYWFNLLFYDRDTLLTEYLIARRNDAISRYIKALLSLHTRILFNPFLRDLFKNEIQFFYSFYLDNAVDDERERTFRKNIAAYLDYFRKYKQDSSLMEVLSAAFDSNYSHISFMQRLKQIKEVLAVLAFNAAKIRANIRLFKNKDLRAAVISALK